MDTEENLSLFGAERLFLVGVLAEKITQSVDAIAKSKYGTNTSLSHAAINASAELIVKIRKI